MRSWTGAIVALGAVVTMEKARSSRTPPSSVMPPESGEQKRYCRLTGLPPLGFGRVSVACGSKNPIVGTMQRPRLMGSSHSPGLPPRAVSMRVLKSRRLAQLASKPQRSSVASSSPMPGTMTGTVAPGRASGPAGQSGRQLKGTCIWMRRMTSVTSSMVSILKRPHIAMSFRPPRAYCLNSQPMIRLSFAMRELPVPCCSSEPWKYEASFTSSTTRRSISLSESPCTR